MYPQRREKCRQGIHLANILPRRASFPVRSPQIMHNGQILPLICDSAFCTEEGWRTTSVVILRYRSVAVPFTWRCKRCESQPQVQAHGAHPETQAHGRVLPVGKPCINPQARAPWAHLDASSWGPPGGANIMGPTWRRKRCGRPSRGANVVARSLCGNARAAMESYRAGNAITNTAPPSGALNAVTVPSKLSTISFTMASPRPAPPLLRAREASLR